MPMFRRKPVVIEAIQFIDTLQHEIAGEEPKWYEVARAMNSAEMGSITYLSDVSQLKIRTLEGVMTAQQGDWIIRGVDQEIYPCKPDIFRRTYDPV